MKIKNSIFILLIQVFALSNIFAQETDSLVGVKLDSLINSGQICFDPVQEDSIIIDDKILITDPIPHFPGGNRALKEWMKNNIRYPDIHRESKVEGVVFIKFEVTMTGEIGEVLIVKNVDPIFDQEAVRIVKSLPKFDPAVQDGNRISSWMVIPITFKLN